MASSYAQAVDDLPTLRFALLLAEADSVEQLERRFRAGFGRLAPVSMFGFNILDPETRDLQRNIAVNVSDAFVERYYSDVMADDPLLRYALSTGRAAYNLALMSEEEWENSEAYRAGYFVHRMRRVAEAPLLASDGSPAGAIHMATSERREFAKPEIELVELVGRVLGLVVESLRARAALEAERDVARAALELSGVPVATSAPRSPDAELNSAAKRLLAEVVDAEEVLNRLIARPGYDGGFARRVEVALSNEDHGTLSAHSTAVGGDHRLVTVLDLRSEGSGLTAPALGELTRREAEIALLVSEGLGDREIADSLHLSHHTVSQYVKRIYRKLEVDSRVALTRLLLGAPIVGRAARKN